MSTLALLVVLLTVAVVLIALAALGYRAYRHPRTATPLLVVGAFAGALAVAVVL